MKRATVRVVRIYLDEGEGNLESLLERLHGREKIRGVTVFRGIAGFGDSGRIHTAGLVDLAMRLPLVVEFFDAPDKIEAALEHLHREFKPAHILSWTAEVELAD